MSVRNSQRHCKCGHKPGEHNSRIRKVNGSVKDMPHPERNQIKPITINLYEAYFKSRVSADKFVSSDDAIRLLRYEINPKDQSVFITYYLDELSEEES